jgi:hypothetical protein
LLIWKFIDEAGLSYTNYDRFGDIFLVQFYLSNENVAIDYHGVNDFIKTDNTNEDRRLSLRNNLRKQIIEKSGVKYVTFNHHDMIQFKDDRAGLIKLIKERIGVSE